jgi:energy-coupling factor transporter ATP-binding protein EcfA2
MPTIKPIPISFRIESVTFSGGQTINVEDDAILVIVGPNNSGKSVALREFYRSLDGKAFNGTVVTSSSTKRAGTVGDLKDWASEALTWTRDDHYSRSLSGLGGAIAIQANEFSSWEEPTLASSIVAHLAALATTDKRLTISLPAEAADPINEPSTHPTHLLQRKPELEELASRYTRMAFGMDLIVDWGGGKLVPLRCGSRPTRDINNDRVSVDYLEKLQRVPFLHAQGDGVRSFVGCLLQAIVADWRIVLLDEPEAFLHPPQAHLLGQMLAKEKPRGRQLILATHSGDLLRGLLDAGTGNLKVVRLERRGDVNVAHELDPARINKLWSDPILRSSNVLDGVFHEQTVICEADTDCRFYSAVLDATYEATVDKGYVRRPDVMFSATGGKERAPVIVAALVSLGVPVSVIGDFDWLNAEEPLKSVAEDMGILWNTVAGQWRTVKSSIEQRTLGLTVERVKQDITAILDPAPKGRLSEDTADRIREVIKFASPWRIAKDAGIRSVAQGEAMASAIRLFEVLRAHHVHLVECGELERFVPSIRGHGSKGTRRRASVCS